jgi:hypothetical protein
MCASVYGELAWRGSCKGSGKPEVSMSKWIKTEWEKLAATNSSAELYRIFLRAIQAISALGLAWALFLTVPMLIQLGAMEGRSYISFWLGVAFLAPVLQIAAAEYSLRAIRGKRFRGTLTALILASFSLFSWMFPLAVFGFYALLNQAYQEKYLRGAPKVFREFLTAIKMNRIPEDQLQAALTPQ